MTGKEEGKTLNPQKIEPLHDQILVELIPEEEVLASGIFVPKAAEVSHFKAVVQEVGPGRYKDGILCPMDVQVGDTVHITRESGLPIPRHDNLLLIDEGKIVATEREGELIPYWDKVLIRLEESEKKLDSGIILVADRNEGFDRGEVLFVGPGYVSKGKHTKMELKPGDKVLFTQYMGVEFSWTGTAEKEFMVREYDVYGVTQESTLESK